MTRCDYRRICLLFAAGSVIFVCGAVFAIEANDSNATAKDTPRSINVEKREPPIVIWYYHAIRDTTESLKIALSSGLITHVCISGTLHRYDGDYGKSRKVLEAIRIAKNSGAKVIWMRNLWPIYKIEDARKEDLFDPTYYIREIKMLRAEANSVGADFTALSTEAYGDTPVKIYLKGRKSIKLSAAQLEQLINVIHEVIAKTGKVDFIVPVGVVRYPEHPIRFLSAMGEHKIATGSYFFDEEEIKKINYDYDIFGVLVNTVHNDGEFKMPYYLPAEVFENSHLWSMRKGVFLFPRVHRATEVAESLAAYAKNLPVKQEEKQ